MTKRVTVQIEALTLIYEKYLEEPSLLIKDLRYIAELKLVSKYGYDSKTTPQAHLRRKDEHHQASSIADVDNLIADWIFRGTNDLRNYLIQGVDEEDKNRLNSFFDTFSKSNFSLPEEIDEKESRQLTEGAKRKITVNSYERSEEARRICINHYGTKCAICNFDFSKKYGSAGKGIIHVHHKKELSEIGEKYEVDPIKDLIPVCPNCHAIIHSRKRAYSIEEIKVFIRENDFNN